MPPVSFHMVGHHAGFQFECALWVSANFILSFHVRVDVLFFHSVALFEYYHCFRTARYHFPRLSLYRQMQRRSVVAGLWTLVPWLLSIEGIFVHVSFPTDTSHSADFIYVILSSVFWCRSPPFFSSSCGSSEPLKVCGGRFVDLGALIAEP